jgi:hypothetical protein
VLNVLGFGLIRGWVKCWVSVRLVRIRLGLLFGLCHVGLELS